MLLPNDRNDCNDFRGDLVPRKYKGWFTRSTKNRRFREHGQYQSFANEETLILRLQSAANRMCWLTSQLGRILVGDRELL